MRSRLLQCEHVPPRIESQREATRFSKGRRGFSYVHVFGAVVVGD